MSQIIVKYGANSMYKDVTNLALYRCVRQGILTIPAGDSQRASIFTDTCPGFVKVIIIILDGVKTIYPADVEINVDVTGLDLTQYQLSPNNRKWFNRDANPLEQLQYIHNNTLLLGGRYVDEFYEQLMAVNYISPQAKVLEIGSNIGRNSLVIATILENQQNLVTLESSQNTCQVLLNNKFINGYDFRVENSALSYRRLIQKRDVTIPSEEDVQGFFPVKSITFEQLQEKYDIQFDTLVADCEGALFYLFGDCPDLLDNINLVIMENDYNDISHKVFVDKVLTDKGFTRVLYSGGTASWGPCVYNFYETWKKL